MEADVLLLDIPRDAPVTTLKLTIEEIEKIIDKYTFNKRDINKAYVKVKILKQQLKKGGHE